MWRRQVRSANLSPGRHLAFPRLLYGGPTCPLPNYSPQARGTPTTRMALRSSQVESHLAANPGHTCGSGSSPSSSRRRLKNRDVLEAVRSETMPRKPHAWNDVNRSDPGRSNPRDKYCHREAAHERLQPLQGERVPRSRNAFRTIYHILLGIPADVRTTDYPLDVLSTNMERTRSRRPDVGRTPHGFPRGRLSHATRMFRTYHEVDRSPPHAWNCRKFGRASG